MSHPDPYRPAPQQPSGPCSPGPYPSGPPAQPGPYGYPYQPASAPPSAAKGAKRDGGNSWGWQILEGLLFFVSGSTGHGVGNTARDRVKTGLLIIGGTIVVIVVVVAVLALTR